MARGWLAGWLLMAAVVSGCSDEAAEARAREAAQKVKESMPDVHGIALAQAAAAQEIELAQAALARLSEYQGAVNGKLDTVTINAIQAFQRSRKLDDDGILDERTLALLRQIPK